MASLSSLNFRLTANIAPFKRGLNKAERSMDKFGRKMQQTGKNLSTKLTAPLAAIGAVSFNVFKSFEQEMSKVKAVSGATAEEFKMLSDNAKQLGASTMFSAREVASLQTEFAKLGFTATEITKVTESTLALAQASGSDLARAAEVAGSTLRAFGLDASETGRVTDVMAKSFSTSALDMEHFANSMKFVAPVAKSAGMSIEETSAMLAILANAGIKGSQAGTSLRRIISEIGASGKPTAEALKDLASKGLNLADAKDEVGRSAQSALLILSEGVDQIKPLTTEFENAKGAANAMATEMGDNAYGAGKRLESAMEGLGISIGEIIAVAVVPLIEGLAKLASKLNNASPSAKRFAVVVGGILAAVGPLMFITGGLIRNYGLLRHALQKSNVVTKIATALQRAYNIALKANPIGVVVTAVTALTAAFYMLNRRKKEAVKAENKLSDSANESIANMQLEKREMNNLLESLKEGNLSTESRRSIINKLNTEYKDYLPNLIDEKDSIDNIATAQKEANDQFRKKIALTAFKDEIAQETERAVKAQKDMNVLQSAYNDLVAKGVDPKKISFTQDQLDDLGVTMVKVSQGGGRRVLFLDDAFFKLNKTIDESSAGISSLETKVDALADSMSTSTEQTKEHNKELEKQKDNVDDLTLSLEGLGNVYEETEDDAEVFDDSFRKAYERAKLFAAKYKELGDTIAFVMRRASIDTIAGMAEIAGAMVMGEASFADMGRFLLGQFAGLLDQLGRLFIQYGLSVEAFVKALALGPTPMGAALAIGAGIAMIAAAGAIRASISKAAAGDIPALAEGGIVTGPTLALIGEGRESEAVIPLSKLNSMMNGGGNRVEVYGRISGSDILLSQERAQRNRTRQRGF